MLGLVLGLSAALGFGSSAVFARLGLQHVRSTTGTLASLVAGTGIAMALALGLHFRDILALSGTAFLWLLLVGALNFPLGRLLNFTGVSLAGVSKTSSIVSSSPLFAAIFAISIGGETISAPILLGTLTIMGGLALILSQR